MQTLAPRTLYDRDEIGVTERLALYAGAFGGVFMFAFTLLSAFGPATIGDVMPSAAIGGAVFGVIFGPLSSWLLRKMAARFHDRLYAGDPDVVPPAPEGYQYRLPCGWMRSPNHAVGGVLYLGNRGMRFVTHLRTPPRYRGELVAEPAATLCVDIVDQALPRFTRIWGRSSVQRIRVSWGSSVAVFAIPSAGEVGARLRLAVSEVSASAGRSS